MDRDLNQPLVLIVEDDLKISEILVAYFERDGFRTVSATDGEIGISHHQTLAPDIVILDVGLPKLDGFSVLNRIRAVGETPVMMLTAMGDAVEKITGLKMGADDYVVKPFNPVEVVTRARGILRRTHSPGQRTAVLRFGALEIDLAGHVVRRTVEGRPQILDLTLTEFRILAYLAGAPRRVFTRAEILDACMSSDNDALERTVDSHLSNLRRKLERAGISGLCVGVRGVGYRFGEVGA